jgi:hypothetical protein
VRGSTESSWADADYAPCDTPPVHTPSDSDPEAEYDHLDESTDEEDTDKATPLRNTRASIPQSHEAPTNSPTRANAKHSYNATSRGTPRSKKTVRPTPKSAEPVLMMPSPSLDETMHQYADQSPTSSSKLRNRNHRSLSSRNPTRTRGSSKASQPQEPLKSQKRRKSQELREPQGQDHGPWYYLNLFYQHVGRPLLAYLWDIFGYANRHFFKPVLGLALGVGIIVFGLQMASTLVASRITNALTPVCLIPGSSYMFSMCAAPRKESLANFEELVNVQGDLEDILEASMESSTLPATIKDSEMAIRDLRFLVRNSNLPSRSQLDLEFHNFVLTANEASVDLSRYNARIGATMDRVIATNTWTIAVLQGLGDQQASIGSASRIFDAMTGAFISPAPTLQQRIFDQYLLHISRNKEEITKLIETAQALLQVLQNMDERLDTIASITGNDDHTLKKSHEELLSQLWTKLGGNKENRKGNERNLNLIRNIDKYRKEARQLVSGTLSKLLDIEFSLGELRDDVAKPELLGMREDYPIMHHLEVVGMGVERLRLARGESMRVEGETYRNRIGGGDGREGVRELGAGKNTPIVNVKAK